MNLREGTRRLALLLGIVGAIAGGYVSFLELVTILPQQARHNRFEQLANSEAAQRERKCRSLGYASGCSELPPPLPPGHTLDKPKYTIENADGTPLASEVNKGGIGTINWNRDYVVESIETQDGQTFYPIPAPSRWLYLFAAILPLLGFALPWGLIRAVGWVGAGFLASTK